MLRNLELNNAIDRVIPIREGIWLTNAVLNIPYDLAGTGPGHGRAAVTIEVRPLDSVLSNILDHEGSIDIVKMDCEGCEYALLASNPKVFTRIDQYVLEIHGSSWILIDWMRSNGYRVDKIISLDKLINIVYLTRS